MSGPFKPVGIDTDSLFPPRVETRLTSKFAPTTHAHTASQVTDLTESVQDTVAAMIIPGTGLTKSYDDTAGTLSLTATGTSASAATETASGVVELATTAEALAGTDTVRAVTPAGVKAVADTKAAASHTHTASQVTDFAEALQDAVAAFILPGTNMTKVYDDVNNTLTLNSTASGSGGSVSSDNVYPASTSAADVLTAANTAVSSNKTLYLPAGTYTDGSTRLDLPANLRMRGAGIDKTIIATNILIRSNHDFADFTVGVDGQRSAFDTATSGARIRRVKFSKGHASQGNLYTISAAVSDILFEDCEFCNNTLGGNGVQFVDKGTSAIHLEDITFDRCKFYNNSRMNYEIVQRSDAGLVVLGYRRINITNSVFLPATNTSGQNMGISFDSEYLQTTDGTTVTTTTKPSSGYSKIEGNVIIGGGYCIELARSVHMSVKNNKVYGGTATGGTGRMLSTSGVLLENAYHQIIGNQFYGTLAAHNVVFQGGYNIVTDNYVETPGYVQWLHAKDNTVSNNQFVTSGVVCVSNEDTYDNSFANNYFTGGSTYTVREADPDSKGDSFRNNHITAPTLDFSIQSGISNLTVKGNRTRTSEGADWAQSSIDTEGSGGGGSGTVDYTGLMRVVLGHSNAATARPSGASAVYWVMDSGVAPTNAVYPDVVFNTTGALSPVGTPPTPAAAFAPSAISGLTHDFDADSVTGSDGSAVATWLNSGSAGGNATQATSGSQPILKVGTFNGHNAIRFDGTDDRIAMANQSLGPAYTVIAVSDLTAFSGAAVLVGADATTSPNRIFQFKFSSASLLTATVFTGGSGTDVSKAIGASSPHLQPTFSTLTRNSSGAVNVYHRENAAQNNSTLAAGNSTSTLALTLGANVLGTNPMAGDLTRVLIWNRELTTSELQQVWDYLVARYALATT